MATANSERKQRISLVHKTITQNQLDNVHLMQNNPLPLDPIYGHFWYDKAEIHNESASV